MLRTGRAEVSPSRPAPVTRSRDDTDVGGGWVAWGLLVAAGVEGTGAGSCHPELFRIARSTNANVVVYEARRLPDGRLDPAAPLEAAWLLLAQDGRREALSGIERALAYGFDVRPGSRPGEWSVTLRAASDRPIRLAEHDGCPAAFAAIDGREALLRLVYVEATGGLLPQVRSVTLVGEDPEHGAEVREPFPVVLHSMALGDDRPGADE